MENRGQGKPVPPREANLPDGNYYLLNIGINNYKHVRQLNNARTDAQAFQELLLANYQFEKTDDLVISLFDEDATKNNIYSTLETLAHKVRPNDSLLIYFAGHGIYHNTWNQGFWVPWDGQPDQFDTYLPFTFLKSQLEAIQSFHTLVIADACYAGAMFEMRDIKPEDEALVRLDRIPSRYLLTSGRNEMVPDGPPGSHSPFAEYLLEFLQMNPDELMSVADLGRDLVRSVAVGANPVPRVEPLPIKGHMGGEFIFRKKDYVFNEQEALPPRRRYQFPEIASSTHPMAGATLRAQPLVYNEQADSFENLKAVQKAIQSYILADDLLGACHFYQKILNEEGYLYDSIIHQESRIHRNNNTARNRTATEESIQVENNRIRFALLDYLHELEPEELKPGVVPA